MFETPIFKRWGFLLYLLQINNMKNLIFFFISILFLSCGVSNVVYTTDDVYYSSPIIKSPTVGNYVDLNDRYLYMKSRGNRWKTFDNDFYYWNFPNNRFNWNPNPFFFDGFSFYDSFFYSPFNLNNPMSHLYWRNSNLFVFNSYGNFHNNVNIKYNNKSYPSNVRSFNHNGYPDVNKSIQSNPRQYNLSTFDNNSSNPRISNVKPMTSGSAPIRKFDQ